MAASTQRREVTLESSLESVNLAEGVVMQAAGSAGFGDEDVHKIGVAVREAAINAYRYGNQQDKRKKIFLVIEFDAERMIIRIRDQGAGFVPEEVPDCLAEENLLCTSGRGLFLMRTFMDEVVVGRAPEGGAEVVLVKALRPNASANGRNQAKGTF